MSENESVKLSYMHYNNSVDCSSGSGSGELENDTRYTSGSSSRSSMASFSIGSLGSILSDTSNVKIDKKCFRNNSSSEKLPIKPVNVDDIFSQEVSEFKGYKKDPSMISSSNSIKKKKMTNSLATRMTMSNTGSRISDDGVDSKLFCLEEADEGASLTRSCSTEDTENYRNMKVKKTYSYFKRQSDIDNKLNQLKASLREMQIFQLIAFFLFAQMIIFALVGNVIYGLRSELKLQSHEFDKIKDLITKSAIFSLSNSKHDNNINIENTSSGGQLSVWNNMINRVDSEYMIWGGGSEKHMILKSMLNSIDPVTQMTPLMKAADLGTFEVARLLVINGADIDVYNNKGYTAIHYAAMNNHINVAKLLLMSNANIHGKAMCKDLTSMNYCTPIQFALYYCHPEMLQLLLESIFLANQNISSHEKFVYDDAICTTGSYRNNKFRKSQVEELLSKFNDKEF